MEEEARRRDGIAALAAAAAEEAGAELERVQKEGNGTQSLPSPLFISLFHLMCIGESWLRVAALPFTFALNLSLMRHPARE